MRRLWKNKAASAAVAIMIAASMFSGSLTTAWAEGEVAETTSEETPTYETSKDSATEEKPAADKEEDGGESEKADQDSTENDADESSDDGKTDDETADGEEADDEAADGEEIDDETADDEETDGETADIEISDEAEDAADGEVGEEGEGTEGENGEEGETPEEPVGPGLTPDIADGTSYSENTTIFNKVIQGVVTVEDDTTVIFENCKFIGTEDDGTGEMGVTVEGDGVAVMRNATFIIMTITTDDDGNDHVGKKNELSFSNIFDGGKVGEYGTTTVSYPCSSYTVGDPDYEEVLSIEAGDLSVDQDSDTVVVYTISYTPDKSGYNTTHMTSIEFDATTIKFPTVLNVEAGGPAEQGDPEGPETDSGDGITPKRTVTVEKKWKNAEKYYDHSKLRVFVKILDSNGKEVGEVELNKNNRWTATYPPADSDQTLDMDAEYFVDEYKIMNEDDEDVTRAYVMIDEQQKNRYSYSRTDEVKVGGTYILGYTLDGNASYQLMSSDGSRIKTTKVPAKTWTDIEPSDTFYWNTLAPSQNGYNNNDSFWNFQHKSTGGYVHGSEDDFSMSSKSTPIKYYARQFRFNYGEIVNEYSMYSHDASGNCTKIAMDGAQIYPIVYSKDTLFTLTNQECFYVYHSSDCTTVRYMLRDDLTDKDAGTFDIVRLVRANHIYGGYYNSYADEGTPYTGESSKWNFDDAYTVSGFKMVPVPGTTYYLKEVPNTYLRPVGHKMYWQKAKTITQYYLVTVIDDDNYLTVGFDGTNFNNESLGDEDIRGADNPANKIFSSVLQGTSKYYYPKDYASVNKGFIDIYAVHYNLDEVLQDGKKAVYTPYLVTPDNVKVWQQTRTSTVTSNGTNISNQVTSLVTEFIADLFENPIRIISTYNSYDSSIKVESNNSSSSSGSNSSSSGGNSSSSGGSSSSSGGSSSSSNNGTSGSSANNASGNGTDAYDTGTSNTDQNNQAGNEAANNNGADNQSGTGSDPNASLEQEKQGGDTQQSEGAWNNEENSSGNWWIWPVAAAACGGFWFIIWKRRKDDDEEEGQPD